MIRSIKNNIFSSTPGMRWKKMTASYWWRHLLVYCVVYINNFPFVKQLFLCAQYKNHKLINITFAISILPALEVMVPVALEKTRNLLYQNRALFKTKTLSPFGKKRLYTVWTLCVLSLILRIYLRRMLNHKWWKQWNNRIIE